MAKELINTKEKLQYLKAAPCTIVYLESTHEKKHKGKLVLGQCEKVQEKNKWGIPADFTITIFEPNVECLTEEQLKIVMFHELLHIGEDYESVTPHDLEDFKYIIDRFGVDWAKKEEAIETIKADYPCKDCISRVAVWEILHNAIKETDKTDYKQIALLKSISYKIQALPSEGDIKDCPEQKKEEIHGNNTDTDPNMPRLQ